jgi:NAD-dependent dihydropyrimidine dehydrogenase PreA subunit
MCEFCVKHGEGKKWYEVMTNYSRELYEQNNVEKYMKEVFANLGNGMGGLAKLAEAKRKKSVFYNFIRKLAVWKAKRDHFGQVIPLEDAEMIMDMVQSITRVPCVCRGMTTGDNKARYCFAVGIDPGGLRGDYPHLKESLETLTAEQAKELLRQFDRQGLVHSVWTFKTPYIGGICNCDHDCLAYRMQVTADLLQTMFKGEYVANIDLAECVGCRNCQKMCQFGAVGYSVNSGKCYINPLQCYGCGVCRGACPKAAIALQDRNRLPELAGVW